MGKRWRESVSVESLTMVNTKLGRQDTSEGRGLCSRRAWELDASWGAWQGLGALGRVHVVLGGRGVDRRRGRGAAQPFPPVLLDDRHPLASVSFPLSLTYPSMSYFCLFCVFFVSLFFIDHDRRLAKKAKAGEERSSREEDG